MARRTSAAIPPAPRKTLLDWVEFNDGDTTDFVLPACGDQAQAFHARIVLDADDSGRGSPEPLASPPGLRLPPMG
jgi:hypothetical protein